MSSYLMPAARQIVASPTVFNGGNIPGFTPSGGTVASSGGSSGDLTPVNSGGSGISIGGTSIGSAGGTPTTNSNGSVSSGVGSFGGTFINPNVNVAQAAAPDASVLSGGNNAYANAAAVAQQLGGQRVNLGSGQLTQASAGQQGLANMLATQAAGGGMSAADIQQQQGIANSVLANQAAAATAGNSANPFLLQRQLMQQQAATNQAGVGQASLLRAQETQQAQQALGGVLQNQAGNALNQATSTAQLNQANQQAGLSGQLAAAQGLSGNSQALLGAQNTTANQNAALVDAQIRGETTGSDSVGTGFGKAVGGILSGIAGALV